MAVVIYPPRGYIWGGRGSLEISSRVAAQIEPRHQRTPIPQQAHMQTRPAAHRGHGWHQTKPKIQGHGDRHLIGVFWIVIIPPKLHPSMGNLGGYCPGIGH